MVLPWVGSCFFSWPEWGSCKRGLSSGDEKCSIQNASDSVRLWISGGFVVVFGGGVVLIVALECTVSTILWIGGGGGFGIDCVEWCLVKTLALDSTGIRSRCCCESELLVQCVKEIWKPGLRENWELLLGIWFKCFPIWNVIKRDLSVFLFRSNSRCSNISARFILFHVSFNPRKPCC